MHRSIQCFSVCLYAVAMAMAMWLVPAPVHAQANTKKFEMTKIVDGVYSFRAFFHRNMIVVTDAGVIVTDPMGPIQAKMMAAEIKKITDKPVKLVIYSHNHWDHIAGAGVFKADGAKILQHELGAKATVPHKNVIPADETWNGPRHDVKIGSQVIELYYLGSSHGAGMTVMRLPKRKLLHTVDVVTHNRLAFRNMPDSVPRNWIKALARIEKLEFDRIIPGHGAPSAPRSAVTAQREYLVALTAAVKKAVGITKNPFAIPKITEIVKKELRPKYGKWAQFDEWMMMNVDRILLEMRIGW